MRNALIFSLLLIFGCSSKQTEQEIFYKELGPKKAKSFKLLMESYEHFLTLNFPQKTSVGARTSELLNQILKDSLNLTFDSLNAVRLLAEIEYSGLRQDIYLYQTEDYKSVYDMGQYLPEPEPGTIDLSEIEDDFEDIFPIDTIKLSEKQKLLNQKKEEELQEYIRTRPYPNENGLFLYSLSKSLNADKNVIAYCQLKRQGLDVSPAILADGYLNNLTEQDYESWQNMIPLAVDIYLFELLVKFGKKN